MSTSLLDHFASLEDPRVERNQLHALLDIVLLTVCAVVSGAHGWEAIEEFGHAKRDWLRKFGGFDNGVPAHDCVANVVSRLTPKGFGECFRSWTQAVATATDGEVIAVDGRRPTHSTIPPSKKRPSSSWFATRKSSPSSTTFRSAADSLSVPSSSTSRAR